MLSLTKYTPQMNDRAKTLCLLISVLVVVFFVLQQMYSYSVTPVFDIQANTALSSSIVAKGSPSIDMHSENESKYMELPQPPVFGTPESFSKNENGTSPPNTSPPQQIEQDNDFSKAMRNFHNLSLDSCPTVHIVMIIVSYNESRSSFLAIKSILMFRQTKLHFHFITDLIAQTILRPMMSSWLLPGVEFDFYNITEVWSHTPWSASQLCPKELLKIAALHLLLPLEIDAVVVVDPNLVISASIFEKLYQALKDLGEIGKLIALSSGKCTIECNDSSVIQMYTSHSTSGVMVLNLAGMRFSVSWRDVWEVIRSEPPDCKQVSSITSLNNVQEMCTFLTCDWFTHGHLSPSAPEDCWAKISVFEQQSESNTLRKLLQYIQDYDGYQLRFKENESCYHADPDLKKPPKSALEEDECAMLKWEGAAKRRMYPYFLGYKYATSDPHDVTLVGHLTPGRLHLIVVVSEHWDGPMSLAIHVTDSEVQQVIDFVSKSQQLSLRKNIAYHLLFKISPSYPENPMRNLGLKFVTTPYVFFDDIDLIPSYDLYDYLKVVIKNTYSMKKTALVVPAFETHNPEINFPRNKQEMVDLIKKNQVLQVHTYWPPGHGPTNYAKWILNTTTSPYTVTWKEFFEPYITVTTSVLPFDPRFVARFHDKASHIEELHRAGYRLLVVNDGFLIHMPHAHFNRSALYPFPCYKERFIKWRQEKRKSIAKID